MNGYFCKYAPFEVFAGFGLPYGQIRPLETGYEDADAILHPNLCCYAKSIFQHVASGNLEGVVVTDCCDAIKRVRDTLPGHCDADIYKIALPRAHSGGAIDLFAGEIRALICTLKEKTGKEFDVKKFLTACKSGEDAQRQDYIGILGARFPSFLIGEIESMSTLPIIDLTCNALQRNFVDVPFEAGFDAVIDWYVKALFSQRPCMRMVDVMARETQCSDPHLRGVIYHTVKFCDFYGFEYAQLSHTLPTIKIETDYTPSFSGQLKTRFQAFFEAAGVLKAKQAAKRMGKNGYFAGVDIGSTSTNAVIIDRDKNMVAWKTVPTSAGGSRAQAALDLAIDAAGILVGGIARIAATGYGREALPFEAEAITEISCHAKGGLHLFPSAKTIIDIGGQDSKVIRLENGAVLDFSMNDKCAAGTGRFLELVAETLEISLGQMAGITDWAEDINIASMCAVFAQSEVISLISQNKSMRDIVRGINLSIATRTASMAARQHAAGPFMMTGGVAQNSGVRMALEEKLGEAIFLPENPQICGALGAALFAAEA